MGGEIAQWREWTHEESIEWESLEHPSHWGVKNWVRDLNGLYRREKAMHEMDFSPDGFEWLDFHDWEQSVVSFWRRDRSGGRGVLVVLNFTPEPRSGYRLGVPAGGWWRELLNSDAAEYGGGGQGNMGGLEASGQESHGRSWSLDLTLPPLGAVFFSREE
jgi:1,4-alpha-glucan branching enzyme